MPWIRNREEVIYWHWLQIVMRWIWNEDLWPNAGTLDFFALEEPYDRIVFTNSRSRSYYSNYRLQERLVRRKCGDMYT